MEPTIQELINTGNKTAELFQACHVGDLDAVKRLINTKECYPCGINLIIQHENMPMLLDPIIAAIWSENKQTKNAIIQLLLPYGTFVFPQNKPHLTNSNYPLYQAFRHKDTVDIMPILDHIFLTVKPDLMTLLNNKKMELSAKSWSRNKVSLRMGYVEVFQKGNLWPKCNGHTQAIPEELPELRGVKTDAAMDFIDEWCQKNLPGMMLALTLFMNDEYLQLKDDASNNTKRFFNILCQLPRDLQDFLLNRGQGNMKSTIITTDVFNKGYFAYGKKLDNPSFFAQPKPESIDNNESSSWCAVM